MRYYRLITIYYGLARAAPHRVPLQGYGMHHKRAWGCGQPLHTPPGWIYSPLEGLTNEDSPKVRKSLKRHGCSTDNAEGSEYNKLAPIHTKLWSCTTQATKENQTAELISTSAYKGLRLDQADPDWLQKLSKRRLQSSFGTFRKELHQPMKSNLIGWMPDNEALSLVRGTPKKGASILLQVASNNPARDRMA